MSGVSAGDYRPRMFARSVDETKDPVAYWRAKRAIWLERAEKARQKGETGYCEACMKEVRRAEERLAPMEAAGIGKEADGGCTGHARSSGAAR